ncbi:hypothetical protein ACH4LN_31290 [Streptomyces albus]|uniref:hypothetical protein n=1 Tax=Streptomyces TaxID=1883 RepID=UPI0033F30434
MTSERTVRRGTVALILCTVVLSSGCGTDEKKEYSVPDSLCGVQVSARLLAPLLPPGKSVKLERKDPLLNHGSIHCNVMVDGKTVFIASQTWQDRGDAMSMAIVQPELEPETLNGSAYFQYSEKGAVKRVDCRAPKKPDEDLFAIPRIPGPQKPDVADVKAFTKNYAKGVAQSDQCRR